MKTMKKILCALLIVVMCLTSAPLGGFDFTAEAADYKVGDIIQFGSYPQSEVTDSKLISALNTVKSDWISYNYYYGESGKTDYVKYKDVCYNGNKYRAVTFSKYRPTGAQKSNGYYINNIYWFSFEPIRWKIMNVDTGLSISEKAIDSQPYHHTSSSNGGYYSNNYEQSDVRKWLTNDFFNSAFSDFEKYCIKETTIDNSATSSRYSSKNTTDKIFLLSRSEASTLGLNERKPIATQYAKSQGAVVDTDSTSQLWSLRTAGNYSYSINYVKHGQLDRNDRDDAIFSDSMGVMPGICIDLDAYDEMINGQFSEEPNPGKDGDNTEASNNYAQEHIDFIKNNKDYNNFVREYNFAEEMSKIESTFKYDWYKIISFKFDNYYDIVLSDLIMKQSTEEKINKLAIEYVGKEQIETGGKIASYIETLINQYNKTGEFNKTIKKDAITELLTGDLDTDNNTYKILSSFLKKCPNAKKALDKYLITVDKAGQLGDLIDVAINSVNDIIESTNYLIAMNSFCNYSESYKKVLETTRNLAENNNTKLYEALDSFIDAYESPVKYALEIRDAVRQTKGKIAFNVFTGIFIKQAFSSLATYLSGTSLGPILSAKIAGCTVSGCIGAVFTGISLGVGISQLITNASAISDNMCMVVAVGELSEFVQNTMKYYDLMLVDYPGEKAAELFDSAFHFYKDCQNYSYDNTIAALDKDAKSVAARFFAKENVETSKELIKNLQAQQKDFSRINCHKIDISSLVFTSIKESYAYTGKKITPTIKNSTYNLNEDYTVTYSNNKSVGVATITIKGKGTYLTGSKKLTFKILPDKTNEFTASLSGKTITFKWDAVPQATGYYFYENVNKKWKKVKTLKGKTEYDYKIKDDNIGLFAIRAFTEINGKTYLSATYETTTIPPISRIKTSVTTSTVTLSWDKVKNADGYRIYQYKDGSWKTINKACKKNSYKVTGLTSGKEYRFAVKPYRENLGKYSFDGYTEISVVTKINAVKNLKITTENKSKHLKLSWSKQSGVTGYQVYRSTTGKDGSYKKVATLKSSVTSFSESNLKSSTTYYYAVRAYKKYGSETKYGSFAKVNGSTKLTNSYVKKLWNKANGVYNDWSIETERYLDDTDYVLVPDPIFGEVIYYKKTVKNITSLSDLKKYLAKYFDSKISDALMSQYLEYDNHLYAYCSSGIGDFGEIDNISIKSQNDISCKISLRFKQNSSWSPSEGQKFRFTTYTQTLKYTEGRWIFSGEFYYDYIGI